MKKGLLGSTALIGATALMAGAAGAAEAPTWKLTGNMNFQFYYVDADAQGTGVTSGTTSNGNTWVIISSLALFNSTATGQDHGWYFGVDESELQLNVSGTADNGLNYGFKIEINANTTDGTVADEARLQLSGGWGTLQMGDEDGAEDVMNFGGENLMGATGGFDGDQDDYIVRAGAFSSIAFSGSVSFSTSSGFAGAPSYPTIAGDTSDATKISYFSPSFSGFKVGASITPTPMAGDGFKADGVWENAIGLGANYDNSFGGVRVRASAVYAMASSNLTFIEDVGAWSVGGIVGFGPVSVGANYTDNSDSGSPVGSGVESSYWDAAVAFETGPMTFSAGYFSSILEGPAVVGDSTYDHLALTADYTVAPGLGVYAEINMITDEIMDAINFGPGANSNDTTSLVLGMNVSF